MELRLGVLDPVSGARADVLVRARDGASLGEVTEQLLGRVLPAGTRAILSVDGVRLPSETLLGAWPLVHGALLHAGTVPERGPATGWQLRVIGGPAAGQVIGIAGGAGAAGGSALVGRDPHADLRLPDPRVSRQHCRVDLHGAGARVVDLGSTNGTTVDGIALVPGALVPGTVVPGAILCVGDSRVVLTRTPGPPAPARPTGDGHLAVHRQPRLDPGHRRVDVAVPAAPGEPERAAVPVLAVLAPLVLGLVLWRVTGATAFLLLTLLSPVLVAGAAVSERRTGRRRRRRARALWSAQRAVAEQVLADAVRADELDRRARWPDLAEVVLTATRAGPRLWQRRRDELDLRLGLADLPARVEATGDLAGLRTTARDVPVVVALGQVGVLGVAGRQGRALARGALLSTAVLHGPGDLQVVVLAPVATTQDWAWTVWLPHTRPDAGQDCRALLGLGPRQAATRVAELVALLDARRAEPPGPGRTDRRPVLLLVDGPAALRGLPGLVRLLAEGPEHGLHVVCVEDDPLLLPPECRASAVVDGAQLLVRTLGQDEITGTADLLTVELAEQAARALAPLQEPDRGGADGLPPHVRWTDEVGLPLSGGTDDVDGVLARWAAPDRSGAAVLGRGTGGPLAVDLVRDGPHALVAGTTGSGKSELLQTLIASLALAHRPDELVLVLVDHKGGAAFGPCAQLPHVVGSVTDLDGSLVERALASLGAELTRREAVLLAAGCKDVVEHRRTAAPGQALPRLVLVVDEFASLVEELPDFIGGLVAIAQRGRSLGVHLVLATQRPEGVVSADIRANTNLRLCLAVTREQESRDVLDSPVAATISRTTPGRAWVRTGHADLTAFQAARVGGRRPVAPTCDPPVVELWPTSEVGDSLPARGRSPAGGDDATDLGLLVAACRAAARALALPAPRSPWLPPLPAATVLPESACAAAPGLRLVYGLLDVPAEQRRRPLVLDLERATHLLVLGAARSGRTTVLRSLAGALARSVSPDDVHLYAVDGGGGGLAPLASLPHAGAVVGLDHPERVDRLLQWLLAEATRRRTALGAAGLDSVGEQRAADRTGGGWPHLLLVLDRWEAFTMAFQDVDAGRLVELVHQLLREGPAVGLHLVLTADRTGLLGRTASLIEDRLLLRMADPADYVAAGLPSGLVPRGLAPGRGWSLAGAPLVAQVALLDADPSGPAQSAALARLSAEVGAPRRPPRRVQALPPRVRLRDLPTSAGLLGVGGDELLPVSARLEPGLLVAGPPGSGRSTALVVLAAGLRGLPVVALAPRPSPVRELPGCLTTDDPGELEAALGDFRVALLLDDAELLTDGPSAALLEEVVRRARDRGTLVLAAGTTAMLLGGYRGAVVELRRARSGLLLSPESPLDGELLGTRLARTALHAPHPGRGLLLQDAVVTPVQVADPA